MRIALGSDEDADLPRAVERWLHDRGYRVELFGALTARGDDAWPSVGRAVAEAVASGNADFGVLCCWTGTGVSIAANKVPGIRAALCADAATAAGAREWNDANVLCLSLRAISAPVAREILDAWLRTQPTSDGAYRAMIEQLRTR